MPAHRLQKRLKLYGFEISIENAKGSLRRWYDPHGKEKGSTKMHFDYGYIRGTKGTDGDHVDVYVGPDTESDRVFIVDQMKKPPGSKKGDGVPWTRFDEQKVMLAFKDAATAKAAYLKQYDDPRFFGSMKEMSVDEFKQKVLDRSNHGKKVANGDMLQYFADHPEKYREYMEQRKKKASLLAAVNLAKLSAGEPILGDKTPAVTTLPAVTAFSEASMSKAERKEGERQVKEAGEGRVGRIADRIDDVGIGLLVAPYVADVAGHSIGKAKSPKLKALGAAIEKSLGTQSGFGKSHGREIAGLSMVAPGVTHTLAKKVDKVMPEKKAELEKIAQQLFDDFEYKTEAEKVAIMRFLGRFAGRARNLVRGVTGGTGTSRMMKAMTQAERAAVTPAAAPSLGQRFRAGVETASKGREVSPAAVQRLERVKSKGLAPGSKGMTAATVPTVKPPTTAPATAPVASAAKGSVPTPTTTTAQKPSKWNPLRPRNLVLGGLAVGTGLTAYGGYKGIQTGAHLLQSHHEVPLAPPGFVGPGRQF